MYKFIFSFHLILELLAFGFGQPFRIEQIELFKEQAGRPEISPDGKKVAYHKKLSDGYYDIFISDLNGRNEVCITCDHSDLPNKHIGQPSWHPSMRWIIFQAEKREHVMSKVGALAAPGIGYHNDIYVMDLETRRAYQLTNLPTKQYIGDKTPSCAILQPHFSPSGDKVSWSERYKDGKGWGKWRIGLADFKIGEKGEPYLDNIQYFTPGVNKEYYESNDFLNEETLVICGNLEAGQSHLGIDVYLFHLQDGSIERLTFSIDDFDECPHPDPLNRYILYLSTEGFPKKRNPWWWKWARGEFWLLSLENPKQKWRITHFNDPKSPYYPGGRTIPAYISWHPTLPLVLLGVVVENQKGKLEDQIYLLSLRSN